MLGSGGVIVLDETVDMVEAAANLAHFYAHESCGQCTPCREGSDWCMDILDRMVAGHGRPEDPETLLRICRFASQGMTICPLGDAFALPISSIVKKFRTEFDAPHRGRHAPPAEEAPGAAVGRAPTRLRGLGEAGDAEAHHRRARRSRSRRGPT